MVNGRVFQSPKLRLEETRLNEVSLYRPSDEADGPIDNEDAPAGAFPPHQRSTWQYTFARVVFPFRMHEAYQN